MIVLTMEQRSPEWFAARTGRPTASSAAKILTSTGKKSAQWKGYLYELVAERAGHVSPPFEPNEAMLEGIRREEESQAAYAFLTGYHVHNVGMVLSATNCASCSPDGLVSATEGGEIGHGLELKNPKPGTFFFELDSGKVPAKYIPQIHMSMSVSGLDRWDYAVYLPNEELIHIPVERDKFTETMSQAVADFCGELDETCLRLGVGTELEQAA